MSETIYQCEYCGQEIPEPGDHCSFCDNGTHFLQRLDCTVDDCLHNCPTEDCMFYKLGFKEED